MGKMEANKPTELFITTWFKSKVKNFMESILEQLLQVTLLCNNKNKIV